jgi:hypothetical protein
MYRRTGSCVWKNGEYLIEGKFDEEGVPTFTYWASVDARVLGECPTLEECIDECADHKRGQKVLRFAAEPETEANPFGTTKEQTQ